MIDFKNLDPENKRIINMYTTARQFKNAISKEEKILMSKGKVINKIYPYIVNKSFSCEVYLKLIITANGDSYKNIHNIMDLYEKANIKEEFEKYIMDNANSSGIEYTIEKLYSDLETISKAFVEWRYIFEKEDLYVSEGILIIFNDYLDKYCLKIIQDKCDINMEEYTNI